MANPVTPDGKDTQIRYVIISTWGQQHILASDETSAEELAAEQLDDMGESSAKILDGMTEEWSQDCHGDWEDDVD